MKHLQSIDTDICLVVVSGLLFLTLEISLKSKMHQEKLNILLK